MGHLTLTLQPFSVWNPEPPRMILVCPSEALIVVDSSHCLRTQSHSPGHGDPYLSVWFVLLSHFQWWSFLPSQICFHYIIKLPGFWDDKTLSVWRLTPILHKFKQALTSFLLLLFADWNILLLDGFHLFYLCSSAFCRFGADAEFLTTLTYLRPLRSSMNFAFYTCYSNSMIGWNFLRSSFSFRYDKR